MLVRAIIPLIALYGSREESEEWEGGKAWKRAACFLPSRELRSIFDWCVFRLWLFAEHSKKLCKMEELLSECTASSTSSSSSSSCPFVFSRNIACVKNGVLESNQAHDEFIKSWYKKKMKDLQRLSQSKNFYAFGRRCVEREKMKVLATRSKVWGRKQKSACVDGVKTRYSTWWNLRFGGLLSSSDNVERLQESERKQSLLDVWNNRKLARYLW